MVTVTRKIPDSERKEPVHFGQDPMDCEWMRSIGSDGRGAGYELGTINGCIATSDRRERLAVEECCKNFC